MTIDVVPIFKGPEEDVFSWRSYDEITAIAERAERDGGFARHGGPDGEEIHVGEHILVGRDALEFMVSLWRRAAERQGYGRAVREARARVKEALDAIRPGGDR